VAGPALSGPLGGGEAGAVMARSSGLAHLARQAFADSLDVTFVVAAGFGLVAAVLVFALVRPRPPAPAPAPARQTSAESVATSA
jgi:hypothetical protein